MEYTRFHNLSEEHKNLVRVVWVYLRGMDFFLTKPTEMLSRNYLIEHDGDTYTVYIENYYTFRIEDHGTHYRVRDSEKRRDRWDNWQTVIKIS